MYNNSKTLCSAAWSELNVDFANRTIKHCCKMQEEPFPDIPTTEMWNNSPIITTAREELLKGIETLACSYCWKNKKSNYRDIKNQWKSIDDFDPEIKIIEVTLDNLCDMSCVYCFEETSSRIAQEIGRPDLIKLKPSKDFVDSFIQFILELSKTQDILLNFSGGEITYSKNFFLFVKKLLSIDELRQRNIDISVISNCNSLEKKQKDLFDLLDKFPESWRFNVAISNESTGEVAELVRYGLDWQRFQQNFERYIAHPRISYIVLSPTFSVFTVKHMYQYFEYIFQASEKYKEKLVLNMFGNWTQNPTELDPAKLPAEYKKYVNETLVLFESYKHLFKEKYEFSINGLVTLKNRIGTEQFNNDELENWLENMSNQKKDKKILLLKNMM
jgi:hypothetical protein